GPAVPAAADNVAGSLATPRDDAANAPVPWVPEPPPGALAVASLAPAWPTPVWLTLAWIVPTDGSGLADGSAIAGWVASASIRASSVAPAVIAGSGFAGSAATAGSVSQTKPKPVGV